MKETLYIRVMRKLAIPLINLLRKTNISANDVSFFMLFVGMLSALFFSRMEYVIALILLHLYLYLDCVDGSLAKIKGTFSKKGMYLDSIIHMIVNPIILFSFVFKYHVGVAFIITFSYSLYSFSSLKVKSLC